MYKESPSRSVLKTITHRLSGTTTTIILVWLMTGQVAAAFAVGGIEIFAKMLIYYIHERAWDKIKFGRVEVEPFILWFTGLPDSGKTSIADSVYAKLSVNSRKIERLDGHNVRVLFPKTGFSRQDRNMHIERIGYLSSILEKNNICVIASFISPYRESRKKIRELAQNFIEVYVDTPVNICEKRDAKGNWSKARNGEIQQFTGIDDPYEAPEDPEIVLNTENMNADDCAQKIIQYLKKKKFV